MEKIQTKFFTAEKVRDNVTRIGGMGGEQCYLIEGGERALLIDALAGVGSLKALVRELTDLPVTVVNTHGHVDHIGADFEYGEVYLDPRDIPLLYAHSDREKRLAFAKSGAWMGPLRTQPRLEDVTVPGPIKTLPLDDGQVFDLGGVALETICVPGHTRGTVVFLDRAARVVYSGDACNANTLLFLPESASIEEYREGLLRLKSFQPAFDGMYGGHGPGPVPTSFIDEAISLCDQIMAGTDDAFPAESLGRRCLYAKAKDETYRRLDGGGANIAYSRENIWKAPA